MSTSTPLSRKLLFPLILALVPVAFFVVLELGLRVVGYGEDFPLFTGETAAPEYLAVNPRIINRFLGRHYSNPYTLASNLTYFLRDKPGDAFRIVVHGGSSAAGFPYGPGASIARMLEQRLKRTFPDRTIEVIDTSIVATNTYAMLDFVDEVIEQKPDAIVIYGGHNEFLGIMGIASSMGFGASFASSMSRPATLLYLSVKDYRVFQLVQDIIRLVQGQGKKDASETGVKEGKSLMAIVAKDQDIAYGSDIFNKGLAQFEGNLSTILGKYRDAGVPVFIGTLVSNLADQEPFVSKPRPGVDVAKWKTLVDSAAEAMEKHDWLEAETFLNHAIELDDGNAIAYFMLGEVYEILGRFPNAYAAYDRAKDMDQLRFRAPVDFNDIIYRVAEKYGATVVEFRERFRNQTHTRLIGDEMMLEHLHPTAEGYFVLADGFYDALQEAHMIGDWSNAVPDDVAMQEIPITKVDRVKARVIVAELTEAFPFKTPKPVPTMDTIPFEDKLGRNLSTKNAMEWQKAMAMQLRYYRSHDRPADALRVALFMADAIPFDAEAQCEAGKLLERFDRLRQALRYLQRSVRYAPDNAQCAQELNDVRHKLGLAGSLSRFGFSGLFM